MTYKISDADLIPHHVWVRDEARHGWACTPPPVGVTRRDMCNGCDEFVGDADMLALEDATGEAAPEGTLFVHLAYALKKARERAHEALLAREVERRRAEVDDIYADLRARMGDSPFLRPAIEATVERIDRRHAR